jgi:hypothetical protein
MSEEQGTGNEWESHPVRKMLYEKLIQGSIPLESKKMGPLAVWNKYCDMDIFEGMEYNDTFTRRLNDLRHQARHEMNRCEQDQKAFNIHRKNFEFSTQDAHGNPVWHGSDAEKLLEQDLNDGLYPTFYKKPRELYISRSQYMEFTLDVFRGHIHQSIKTKKFIHTLKIRDEAKKTAKQAKQEKKIAAEAKRKESEAKKKAAEVAKQAKQQEKKIAAEVAKQAKQEKKIAAEAKKKSAEAKK